MCVGDSITEGIASSTIGYGYRGPLYNLLIAGGYTNVQMVGTHNTGQGNAPYTLPPAGQFHDGFGGWTTAQIASNMNAWLTALATGYGNGGTGNTGNLLPDYMLLMIGTNDYGGSLAGVNASIATILNTVHTLSPNTEVIARQGYSPCGWPSRPFRLEHPEQCQYRVPGRCRQGLGLQRHALGPQHQLPLANRPGRWRASHRPRLCVDGPAVV